jgi:hypothetical protein
MSCFRPFIRFEVPYKVRGYVSTPGKPFLDKVYPDYYVLLNADGSERVAARVHNGAVLVRVPRDVVPQDFAAEFHSSHKYDFVPCGACEDCRLRNRRELTYRLVAEYDDYYNDHPEDPLRESVLFLTLTYDDQHLVWKKGLMPFDQKLGSLEIIDRPSLVKEHVQTFMKDLRSWCDYHHPGLKLRFYVCGEYGPSTLRPHYHLILYGMPDTVLREYGCKIWSVKDKLFESLKLDEIWGRGRVLYGIANFATMQYCAGYVLKKLTSQDTELDEFLFYEALQDDATVSADQKEFSFREFRGKTKIDRSPLMIEDTFHHGSRRPGLGRGYYERFKDQIMLDDAMTIINGYGKPIRVKPSAYYDRLYDGEHRTWDNVPSKVHLLKKSKRFKLATERINSILLQKNITLKTYLEKKNFIVRNGFSKIKRSTM